MSNPDNRFLALDLAVRHKTREESAGDVVKSAEKYLAFIQVDGAAIIVTDAMVNSFLSWPLPKSVSSDPCVTNSAYKFERFGTSLLTADEARAMLAHVLGST